LLAYGVTKGLFHLLFEKQTFEILDNATEYVKLFDENNGIEVAKVTTISYGCCIEAQVLASIAKLSEKITIENIDPSIIGVLY
jgi:F-type H+-transporting ATPase subunit delta